MAGETIEYEILAALIDYLGQAMACTPDGRPAEVRVNVGQVEDGGCDSLVATLTSVAGMIEGTSLDLIPEYVRPAHRDDVGLVMEFAITLARHCWPTDVQRGEDGSEMTYNRSVGADTEAASASLLVDGRVLHAALLHALAHPSEWWDDSDVYPFDYGVGRRTVVRDVACAGWTIPVQLEIGALCAFVQCEATEPDPGAPMDFAGNDRTDVPAKGSVDVRPAWMA